MTNLFLLIFGIAVLVTILLLTLLSGRPEKQQQQCKEGPTPEQELAGVLASYEKMLSESTLRLSDRMSSIEETVKTTPTKVLETIKGSTNQLRGALGEFIQFTKLKAEYDSIISLGDVVDYIAIKYPSEGKDGTIDFIEVKTGSARLNSYQRHVRDLIKAKKIGFKSVKVTLDELDVKEELNAK